MTVPSPSAAKISDPEVCIIELVVHEPSRCGRSNSVNSTSICVPALPMRARNLVPRLIGSGVSNPTPAIAGLYCGSLRESATKSNTSSTGRSIRISPSILAMSHLHVLVAPVRQWAFQVAAPLGF
jgi:hypothetical protein